MRKTKVRTRVLALLTTVAMVISFIAVSAGAYTVESGYAAVGKVDAAAHKAEVLLASGQQGTVQFTGDAPQTGAVYRYSRDLRNVYTFTAPEVNHGGEGVSNQLSDPGTQYRVNKGGWIWIFNAGTVYQIPGKPVFFRFGENKWKVGTIDLVEQSDTSDIYGYVLDAGQFTGGYYYPGAVVFGGIKDGAVDTTDYAGAFPSGLEADKDLSNFTTPLHETYVEAGYAAIGKVDADKVEILKDNGDQGYVTYKGEAPKTGGVYRYVRSTDNKYTFTVPMVNLSSVDAATYPNVSCWNANTSHDYGGYLVDGVSNLHFPTDATPIFVHTDKMTWKLTNRACFPETSQTVALYLLDSTARTDGEKRYDVDALVFGGLKDGGEVDTAGQSSLTLPEKTYDLSELTLDLHAVAEETGYAAVGKVDKEAKKVEILRGDAKYGSVDYVGSAPVTGGVYWFSRYADGTYSFAEPKANRGRSSVVDPAKPAITMNLDYEHGGYMWDSDGENHWYFYENTTPIFVHTEGNKWQLGTKACFTANGSAPAYQLDVIPQTQKNYFDAHALVLGGLKADGEVDAAGIADLKLDLPEAVDLSELTGEMAPYVKPVEPDPSTPETDPSTPETDPTTPETEPPVEYPDGKYQPSGAVTETGYAAIGVIDGDKSKVEVLFSNGTQGSVYYGGKAPKTGAVYGYEKHDNNVYIFSEKVGNFGFSDQLVKDAAWPMWYEPHGWVWDANQPAADIFHVQPPTPIFVRYDNNQWAITTVDKVTYTEGKTYAFTYALDITPRSEWDTAERKNFFAGAMVMGNWNGDGTIDTAGYAEILGSLKPSADLSKFTKDLSTPTDADTQRKTYTAEGKALARGYAAVGLVNTISSKAEVLLANGRHGTVKFAGTAPRSGAVYGYEIYANDIFVFTEKTGNFGNSSQFGPGWNLWFEPQGWAWDANSPVQDCFHVQPPTPIFLRFGDNRWAIVTINQVKGKVGTDWAYGYALDTTSRSEWNTNGLNNFFAGALVMGGWNSDGTIDTTGFAELFGKITPIELGAFTTDITSPATGDSFPIAFVLVCMVCAIGGLGVTVIAKKKLF